MAGKTIEALSDLYNNIRNFQFKLTDDFIVNYAGKNPDWEALGYITYKRTYARRVDGEDRLEDWWETVKRVVEGCYTFQKWHCDRLGLPWNPWKAQKSAQKMYDLVFNMKFLPPGRGLWAMGTELVYKLGSAPICNCFSYETQIITGEGIKLIGDCVDTEQLLLTSGGKWVSAPIQSFGKQKLMRLTLRRQGIEKEIYCTPEHRWFVQSRKGDMRGKGYYECLTKDLESNVRLQYMFGNGVKQVRPSPFGIAHGISFGGGSGTSLYLCGEKDKELLKYFPLNSTLTEPNKCAGGAIRVADLPKFFKARPDMNESRSYLYGWLAGYFAAEGTCDKQGACYLASANLENIHFVRDICALIGIGTYGIDTQDRVSNLDNQKHTIHRIRLIRDTLPEDFFLLTKHKENFINNPTKSRRYWNVVSVEETDREEEVYCATVENYGSFTLADNILTGNCAFVSTKEIDVDFSGPFTFLMDMSMLGVGVGGDAKGAGLVTIKAPKTTDIPYIVEDSRKGWVDLVGRVLDSFVGRETLPINIDYSLIRPKGALIKTFGGVAAGPEPLIECINSLIKLLTPKDGIPYRITSSQIVDIFNFIGKAVVSGNVRRSAELMLGFPNDDEFLDLKLNKKALADRRWASNNSVFAEIGMDYAPMVSRTVKNGEPGYFWLDVARHYGRLKDGYGNHDIMVEGANPCLPAWAEIMTENGPKKVKELIGSQFTAIVNGKPYKSTDKGFFLTSNLMPVFRYKTKEGYSFDCTPNHRVKILSSTGQDEWVEAQKLSPGDALVINNHRGLAWAGELNRDEGWLLGSLFGDGNIHYNSARLTFWGPNKWHMLGHASELIASTVGARSDCGSTQEGVPSRDLVSLGSAKLYELAKKYNVKVDMEEIPHIEKGTSASFYAGFLSGWFDADGHVEGTQEKGCSVRLSSSSYPALQMAQRMLLRLGIVSTIYPLYPEGMREMPDGKGGKKLYFCNATYRLAISNDSIAEFAEVIGFVDPDKKAKLDSILKNYKRRPNQSKFVAHFEGSEFVTECPVYDCTIEEVHEFEHGGLCLHNCVEQSLESYEMCNLVELNPAAHDSFEDFLETCKYAYLYAKTVTLIPSHNPRTNAVMLRNRRIGLSQTGIIAAIKKFGLRSYLKACNKAYDHVCELDDLYSNWLCVPKSIKKTTVKPSGTVSKLMNVPPGIHWPEAEYYIQRIRIADNSPLLDDLRKAGYKIVKDIYADHTMVVEFPMKEQNFDRGKANVSVWEQVQLHALIQEFWSDNQVSQTVTFKPEEAEDIASVLQYYEGKLKAISFLPLTDHGYELAPLEAIKKEDYDKLMKKIKPLKALSITENEIVEKFCTNEGCEIKIPQKT